MKDRLLVLGAPLADRLGQPALPLAAVGGEHRPPLHSHALLMGRSFFPHLTSGPFQRGLHETFVFSILACLVAAGASLLRGGRYYADEPAADIVRRAARVSALR